MMTYRIHYTLPDGTKDSILVSGTTAEEIRARALKELATRDGRQPWSERVGAPEDHHP